MVNRDDHNSPQSDGVFAAKFVRPVGDHFNRAMRSDPSNRHRFCFFCIKNPSVCDPLRACEYSGDAAKGPNL